MPYHPQMQFTQIAIIIAPSIAAIIRYHILYSTTIYNPVKNTGIIVKFLLFHLNSIFYILKSIGKRLLHESVFHHCTHSDDI